MIQKVAAVLGALFIGHVLNVFLPGHHYAVGMLVGGALGWCAKVWASEYTITSTNNVKVELQVGQQ